MPNVKHASAAAIVLGLSLEIIAAQTNPNFSRTQPQEVVEQLWTSAAAGELLTRDGWNRASRFFTQPGPLSREKSFNVVSNYYGVNRTAMDGAVAIVDMEFTNLGRIDSALRYTPPPKTPAYKTSLEYRLISVPMPSITYGADGKAKPVDSDVVASAVWRIEGSQPPFTTVNTAIRYVLESRDRAKDPIVKKNADETLAQLLRFH